MEPTSVVAWAETFPPSRGVVALCYQHKPLDNEVPQLHATQSEPLDYSNARSKEMNRGTVYLDS